MYLATDNLVLAFFHRQGDSICGDHNHFHNIMKNLSKIKLLLQQQQNNETRSHQIFHIQDNRTKSVLLSSWPDHYPNEIIGSSAQMDHLLTVDSTSCFHCVQQPIQTTNLGQKLHCFFIQYGSISFVLIRLRNNNNNNLMLSSSTSLPSSSPVVYHHPYTRTSAPSSPTTTTSKSIIKLENLLLPTPPTSNMMTIMKHQRNQCQSCGTDSSPEWRRGPTGHKT
jgi:hypothetical protein